MLFAIAFFRVILRLRRALADAGFVVSFPVEGAKAFLGICGEDLQENIDHARLNDVSYADDLALVIAVKASEMLMSLKIVGEIIWRVYEECGFRINWGPQKTAATVKWVGAEGRRYRLQLEQEMKNCITLVRGTRTAPFNIVAGYKHVGTYSPINCGMGVEAKMRPNAIWHKLAPLRRKLFGSKWIRMDVKRQAL